MVNEVNVRRVINKIRDEENFFSMVDFEVPTWFLTELDNDEFIEKYGAPKPHCGTPACIGGWAEHIMSKEDNIGTYLSTSQDSEWLGIDLELVDELFYPQHKPLEEITRKEAIDVLENLIITGEVNWNTTKETI